MTGREQIYQPDAAMTDREQVYRLDGAAMTDERALHEYLKAQLELPEYYGKNLDALYDLLTDITSDTRIILENEGVLSERLGWYGRQLLRVFRDASEDNRYLTVEYR